MKRLLRNISCMLILATIFFCACGNQDKDDESNDSGNDEYIELTLENYDYWLSIDATLTDSGSAAQGSYRWATYSATINGAVSGIFEDCEIWYSFEGSDTIHTVKLNASGFAKFSYSVVNGKDIQYVGASGKIYV